MTSSSLRDIAFPALFSTLLTSWMASGTLLVLLTSWGEGTSHGQIPLVSSKYPKFDVLLPRPC